MFYLVGVFEELKYIAPIFLYELAFNTEAFPWRLQVNATHNQM